MGNTFLEKQVARDQKIYRAAEYLTEQFMMDTLQITLHREFGFGYDRLQRLNKLWTEVQREFAPAMNPSTDVEADVMQERMDRVLAQIISGKMELIPFGERYPELKKVSYKKGKWKND